MFDAREAVAALDFQALFDATTPLLIRVAWRITGSEESAEDIVQDSFIRMLEKKIPFPSQDDAKYWLIRVVKNAALNYAKRKGREAKAYERYLRDVNDGTPSPEDEAMVKEDAETMRALLERLPEKYREVLVLKEYAELNYKEIGRVLGITEGNVKVRVFRARECLSGKYKEVAGDVS